MTGGAGTPGRLARPAALRWLGLWGFWLLLGQPDLGAPPAALAADLGVGALAAAAATWASVHLLPPGHLRLRPGALPGLAGRFLGQSVLAGIDVAYRVFHPRLPLKPGLLAYPVGLPPGPARSVFAALTSLVPGTVPLGSDPDGRLVYHCLDTDAPVAAGLAADEALVTRALGLDPGGRP